MIEVWLKDGRVEKKRYEVCRMLKVMLDLPNDVSVYYKQHDKSLQVGFYRYHHQYHLNIGRINHEERIRLQVYKKEEGQRAAS